MNLWDIIAVQPMINILIVLAHYLFNSFGLAIIALTVIVNAAMLPLTLQQIRSSKAMQLLQPKLAEIQKRYARDKERLAQEQMRLFKEAGVSPAGCLLPLLIQLPVWFALYQSIMRVLAIIPENLLSLYQYLYPWPVVYSALPLPNSFLGFDLATGSNMLLAILVGGTMWVQQKMVMTPTADPRQQSQANMMLWLMPIMFAYFTLTFPSGLALFWVTSSVIRIALQYSVTGWGELVKSAPKKPEDKEDKQLEVEKPPQDANIVASTLTQEEGSRHEESGSKWQDRRGSYPKSLREARRKPRRGRGHRRKRR